MNTEVVDCHGQTFVHMNNSAPLLHLLQQHNPVQPVQNTITLYCITTSNPLNKGYVMQQCNKRV